MEAINCIIETPKGYGVKFDFNHKLGTLELKKALPSGLVFPFDFGFVPGTKGEDGDPLDVVVVSEFPSFPGCAVKCRIIGVINAKQKEKNGETIRNDRLVAIPEVSVQYGSTTELKQLPGKIVRELENFFINYNAQAGKKFTPLQRRGSNAAKRLIQAARQDAEPTKQIQLLLPLYSNRGALFPESYFNQVKEKLLGTFGGVTIYTQSPAEGLWQKNGKKVVGDTIIVFEVMAASIDASFWKKYKEELKLKFKQDDLVIRQCEMGLL